jgi:hypothetical protein
VRPASQRDPAFYKLANIVATAIKNNKAANKHNRDQGWQVENLMDLERKFKKSILKFAQSREIYKKFILLIVAEKKNILTARPYFREKANTFSKKITPAIKNADVKRLQQFDINFQMIQFIRENWLGKFPVQSERYYHRIGTQRRVLIEDNMPLAINEAAKFYRNTPKSHVTKMDLIMACADGLASGIDKYCGAYTKVFRSVCIGRMKGNMVDLYSETVLHFFPSDKRILYKANIIRARKGIEDLHLLAEAVNESFAQDVRDGKKGIKEKVTADQLRLLMNAASTVSADSKKKDDEGHNVYSVTPDAAETPEEAVERADSVRKMIGAAKDLDTLSKKLLRLKGIPL